MVEKFYRLSAGEAIDGSLWAVRKEAKIKKYASECAKKAAGAIAQEDWDLALFEFVQVCKIQAAIFVRMGNLRITEFFERSLSYWLRSEKIRADLLFTQREFYLYLTGKVCLGILTVALS